MRSDGAGASSALDRPTVGGAIELVALREEDVLSSVDGWMPRWTHLLTLVLAGAVLAGILLDHRARERETEQLLDAVTLAEATVQASRESVAAVAVL